MRKVNIDLIPYYEWYSMWRDWDTVTVEDFLNGKVENPYSMISDWLETVAITIGSNIIGKEVFYSLNAVGRNEITYDTYLEGCIILKGKVTNVTDSVIQIDGKDYWYSKGNAILFDKPEYCLLSLLYDGEELFEGLELGREYGEDLFVIDESVQMEM